MQAAANIPARPSSRFWRLLFWITLIHFILVGFVVLGFLQLQSFRALRALHPKQLGLINAISLWLYLSAPLAYCGLAFADIAALFISWRLAHRAPRSRSMIIVYLAATFALVAVSGAGVANAARIGKFTFTSRTFAFNSSTTMIYVLGTNVVLPLLIWDAIFVLPALLILARLIFRGWPTREPGLCASCGYDLTGNVSGTCPECGTPLNERR